MTLCKPYSSATLSRFTFIRQHAGLLTHCKIYSEDFYVPDDSYIDFFNPSSVSFANCSLNRDLDTAT